MEQIHRNHCLWFNKFSFEKKNFIKINVVIGYSYSDNNLIKFLKENDRIELYKDVNEKKISKLFRVVRFANDCSIRSTISYELAAGQDVYISFGLHVNHPIAYFSRSFTKKNLIFGLGNITNF